MTLIRYQGRKVSPHWYRRYVLGAAARSIAVQRKYYKPAIYARFHLPEIPGTGERAETRLVRINTPRDLEWISDMQDGYAQLGGAWTTFFPDLLNIASEPTRPAA